MPTFLRDQWYGWYADDAYVWAQATFQDGFGCEIRKSPGVLKLAHKVTAATGTIAAKINKILAYNDWTHYAYCFTDDGKVYGLKISDNSLTEVYDLVADGSTADSSPGIKNAILYGAHIYFASWNKLHRTSTIGIFTTVDVDRQSVGWTFGSMVLFKKKVYVDNNAKLASYDGTTRTSNAVATQAHIKWLELIGNNLYIYAGWVKWGNSWHIEIRDGVNLVDSYLNRWPENLIGAVANGSMQYILSGNIQSDGFKARVFKASGFQKSKAIELAKEPTENPNAIKLVEDLFTFWVAWWVATFGKLDSKYPDALMQERKTSNGVATDEILSIAYVPSINSSYVDRMLFSWVDAAGTWYGVDYIDNTKYQSTGEATSLYFQDQTKTQKKTTKAVKLWFTQIAAGETIKVYLREDGATARGSAVLTVDASDSDDTGVVYKTTYPSRDFSIIEAKIEVNSGTSDATTPEARALMIDYDFIEID